MPWPVPSARTIAERFAGTLEAGLLRIRPLLDPVALSRSVRSARGVLAQIGRAIALEAREVHDHVAWWGRQYFIDTAEEEMILRHANIWGIAQRAASSAIGNLDIEGTAGTALPAGLEFRMSDSARFVTTSTATIGVDGRVSVPAQAIAAGAAGNIEAGIRLVTYTPFPEISRATVALPGFAGGADEETLIELQTAVLSHIRQRPHGGAGFDYPTWVGRQFDTRAVAVAPEWIGRGSVGIIVAMKDADGSARVPTAPECEAILAYLGAPGSPTGVRPVTAHIVVVACELEAIDISVRIRPDNVATRAAVTDAFARYVATIGDADDPQNATPIGARIEPSRISEAISAASGEYSHDLTVPSAPYTLGNKKFPTAGVITFLDPP
jgi:uncharacterized phage protein gp47/JayE